MRTSQLAAFAAIIFLFFIIILLFVMIFIQPKLYVARIARYYALNKKIIEYISMYSILDSRWDFNSSQRIIDYLAGWKYSQLLNDKNSEKYYTHVLKTAMKKMISNHIVTGFSVGKEWIGIPCDSQRIIEIFIDKGTPLVICLPNVNP